MSKLFALIRATLLSPKNLKFLTFFVVSASIMLAQVRICDYLEEIRFRWRSWKNLCVYYKNREGEINAANSQLNGGCVCVTCNWRKQRLAVISNLTITYDFFSCQKCAQIVHKAGESLFRLGGVFSFFTINNRPI